VGGIVVACAQDKELLTTQPLTLGSVEFFVPGHYLVLIVMQNTSSHFSRSNEDLFSF
jgi:hypothetical protein